MPTTTPVLAGTAGAIATATAGNRTRFIAFRVLFNSRFYYPVLGVLFLDLGLSATEYTLLNFVWALVIVLAEVPSGVLADRVGRKPLLMAASVCMVFEMLALLCAPRNGGLILLGLCLVNRVLSGVAEAMASGADESLAYDSLPVASRSKEWPSVLGSVMRWQSLMMPVAMLAGATVYDASVMNRGFVALGIHFQLQPDSAARLPIALTLLSALAVCGIVWGMREPGPQTAEERHTKTETKHSTTPWGDMRSAATWIVKSPIALFAICGGVLLDSVVRLFLTFGSVYYRLIDLPVASFGIIGAFSGALGFVVAPFASYLVRSGSLWRNYIVLASVTFAGLLGVGLVIPLWGVLFTVPLLGAMIALGYILSHTLNAQVSSAQRATVLSFKGLVFNLGYGFVSLLFALALRVLRGQGNADQAFATALRVLPIWLAATLAVLTVSFRRHRAPLQAQAMPENDP
jgi:MFS family permease